MQLELNAAGAHGVQLLLDIGGMSLATSSMRMMLSPLKCLRVL
jgi:hypothetical protein